MKSRPINHSQDLLFKNRLSRQLNPTHELFQLGKQIDWGVFETEFGCSFLEGRSRPPKPIRLIVGLLMLQHIYNLSDERVVLQWVENPYWQYFCGFDFLQWELPIDPSSLTRWRQRIGEKGLEKILSATINTAINEKVVLASSFKNVIVDTTVMEKNVTYPTDAKLYDRAREYLVKAAKHFRIPLRQSYARVSKRALRNVSRYAHARRMKQARKATKQIKTWLGRIYREIRHYANELPKVKEKLKDLILVVDRLLYQTKETPCKIYSLHEPDVRCISKGKAHKKYEFGCKVSLVITHKEGLALSMQALEGAPYDGHTLKNAIHHAESISKVNIEKVFVDRGYRGHDVLNKKVYKSGQKKGVTSWIYKMLKRRQAIEPHIGHMKSEGKLRRNFLKGNLGDRLNALLCAVGHNLRLILAHHRKQKVYS
jgi:transposase, IS5 family